MAENNEKDESKRRERRTAIRVPIQITYVDIKTGEGNVLKGYIKNVGTGGMGIVVSVPMEIAVGTAVMLDFELPGMRYKFSNIKSTVRWHAAPALGVGFTEVSAEDRAKISDYVDSMRELVDAKNGYKKAESTAMPEGRSEQRRTLRVPLHMYWVDIKTGEGGMIKGYIKNISIGGMGVIIEGALDVTVSTMVMLYFELPGIDYRFRDIEGMVRWYEGKSMGVEFMELTDKDNTEITAYVKSMSDFIGN